MSREPRTYQTFFAELKRRQVFKVAAVYGAVTFVVLQAIDLIVPALNLPEVVMTATVVMSLAAFPVALALTWVFDVTPRGVSRTDPAKTGELEAIVAQPVGRRWPAGILALAGTLALILGGWWTLQRGDSSAGAPAVEDRPAADAVRTAPDRKKIAVLPFENLGAAEDEYFSDGLTEEIISRLAELNGLAVISRTSALQYKGTIKTIGQIGEELDVDYILEGTVRWERTGDDSRIRVTPQLIQVEDDTHLWTERYDAVLAGVFEIQSDIAASVAEAMGMTLLEPAAGSGSRQPTDNLEAYTYFLRGRDLLKRGYTEEQTWGATAQLQRAVDLDPNFAQARAWLSRAHTQLYWFFFDRSDERLEIAQQELDRALELDPELPAAYLASGELHYRLRDYERALPELRIARAKLPGDGEVAHTIGIALRRMGDWEATIEPLRESAELDPQSAETIHTVGSTLFYMRRYEEAASYLDRAATLQLDWPQPLLYRAWVELAWNGDAEAARRIIETAQERIAPNPILPAVDDVQPWQMLRIIGGDDSEWLAGLPASFFGNDTASFYLVQAESAERMGRTQEAVDAYESLRTMMERALGQRPDEARYHSLLGVALAGLGRSEEAVAQARRATELLPVTVDALWGHAFHVNLAWIYARLGEADPALEELEYVLSIPGPSSLALLAIDPHYEKLREDPRFAQLSDSSQTGRR
jgi:TolB-like protein/Flp pilus assembly protein TadD